MTLRHKNTKTSEVKKMENGLVGKEREKFERARERALGLNFYGYVKHIENIIDELKEIEKLDNKFWKNKGNTLIF